MERLQLDLYSTDVQQPQEPNRARACVHKACDQRKKPQEAPRRVVHTEEVRRAHRANDLANETCRNRRRHADGWDAVGWSHLLTGTVASRRDAWVPDLM